MVEISVIIPTFKDWKRLSLCLQALEKQSFGSSNFEIIVINNLPGDLPPEGCKLPSNAVLVDEGNPGSYAARNTGIGIAMGHILAFTDSDCIPDKDWLKNAFRYFVEEKAERIGGNVKIFYKDPQNKTLAELYESVFAFNQKRNVEKHKASITANLVVKKHLFERIGNFDSTVKSGGDFEWNRRANLQNANLIFAHDVVVYHPARKTLCELANKKRRVYGGQKTFKFNSLKTASKELLYLPLLIYFNLLLPVYRLIVQKGPSIVNKAKILYVIVILYLVTQIEYFRLLFGRQPVR